MDEEAGKHTRNFLFVERGLHKALQQPIAGVIEGHVTGLSQGRMYSQVWQKSRVTAHWIGMNTRGACQMHTTFPLVHHSISHPYARCSGWRLPHHPWR
jgi:hypothetical protein